MEFIKNINKKWVLNPNYSILQNYSTSVDRKDIDFGEIIVKAVDMDFTEAAFQIVSISNIDNSIDVIVERIISKLEKNSIKLKRVLRKIIKEWMENPSSFKEQTDYHYSKDTYKNEGLLNDNEYSTSVGYVFDRLSEHYPSKIVTGCGGATYYSLDVIVKGLDELDSWVITESKKVHLPFLRIMMLIVKYISKMGFIYISLVMILLDHLQ